MVDPSKDEKPKIMPPLPPWWDFGGEMNPTRLLMNPALLLHRLLCIISFGRSNLQKIWGKTHKRPSWREFRKDVKTRIEHINLVATLMLATIAAFCTTEPPAQSRMIPYTNAVPYCLLLVSMGFAFVGILAGASIVFITHKTNSKWFREVLMGSRSRIWTTMTIASLPFFMTVLSILFFAAGIAAAAVHSRILILQFGWSSFVLVPLVAWLAFVWIVWSGPVVQE